MRNINDYYKEEFSKIDISEDESKIISQKIQNKYTAYQKRKKTFKYISSIFLVFILSISIVYADEIKEFINNIKITTTVNKEGRKTIEAKSEDFRKVINYDANLPEIDPQKGENSKDYLISEIEEMLNTKILKSKILKTDKIKIYSLTKENGKIASAHFIVNGVLDDKIKKIDMHISFATKFYPNDVYVGWKSSDSLKNENYYIENLKTDSYILTLNTEMRRNGYYDILFVYDNIAYRINIIIVDNPDNRRPILEDFLNSLSY